MSDKNATVISTRIRLARNVSGYPFPNKLTAKKAEELAGAVYGAVKTVDTFSAYKMSGLKALESEALKESHLISKELIAVSARGSVLINADRSVSIMLCEEDHIRAQCIRPGLNLDECYHAIDKIDDCISGRLPYAFNEKLGYLTSCPTNLGTGMRASVMMFLPGLTRLNALEEAMNAVGRLRMTVRGVYGEGSSADGCIYQISNQISLGYNEKEICGMVSTAANHILQAEEKARAILKERAGERLEDEVMRAYGIARYAKLLSVDDMFKLTTLIKLGVYYGWIRVRDAGGLERLITDMQPGILGLKTGIPYENARETDRARAQAVRETLARISE